jgi:hypothetical protein
MKENQPGKVSSNTDGLNLVAQAWENREGPAVFTTMDAAKTPCAIYVGEIRYVPGEGFIAADNYFSKTRAGRRRLRPHRQFRHPFHRRFLRRLLAHPFTAAREIKRFLQNKADWIIRRFLAPSVCLLIQSGQATWSLGTLLMLPAVSRSFTRCEWGQLALRSNRPCHVPPASRCILNRGIMKGHDLR